MPSVLVHGIALFEQLINILRLIKMWLFVCVSAYVCVSFYQVEIALQIYYHSPFHIPFNNIDFTSWRIYDLTRGQGGGGQA